MTVRPTRPRFHLRPTGPMTRLLRQIAAGHAVAVGAIPAGERLRGRAAILSGLIRRRLVAAEERERVTVYVVTEAGRRELAASQPLVKAGGP